MKFHYIDDYPSVIYFFMSSVKLAQLKKIFFKKTKPLFNFNLQTLMGLA